MCCTHPAQFVRIGETRMPAPSTAISLRLPDDVLAELDSRVGLDGMRNRSDVIREAVRTHVRQQPSRPSMDTVTIQIGSAVRTRLATLFELRGITAQDAALQGLLDYVDKAIADELSDIDDKLQSRLLTKRAETLPSKEYTE